MRSAIRTPVLRAALAIGVAALLAAAGGTAAASTATTATPAAARAASVPADVPTTPLSFLDIPARDGVVLKANLIAPTTPGRHPAIVFINSWGLNDAEYIAQANVFARRGYVVLSYTTRGFWGSGGEIETAGPKDIDDVSAVLDWLVAHTAADPAHIGAAGASYGAGISLIASAFDPRIKAVVAMSAWADLVASLYGNDTRRPQAVWLLKMAAQLCGKPSAELNTVIDDYFANRNIEAIKSWGRTRSATTYLSAINRNKPAIMIANGYGDSLFPPNQVIDFYGKLTGPKRLEFAPGDHVTVEGTGLFGLPNHVWDSSYRWFDRYLSGIASGIDTEAPVVLRHLDSDAVESYTDWADVTGSTRRLALGAVRWYDGTGPLATATPATGWSKGIWTGTDTTAGAGVALLSNTWGAATGNTPTVWLPTVNRLNAGVWTSDPVADGAAIRGNPKLHLQVNSPQSQGTLVAYLYDSDSGGGARLISHAPITWLSPTNTLDLKFDATAYDLPAGHRLTLVVDTADPLYLDANRWGSQLSFTGASWFDIPLR